MTNTTACTRGHPYTEESIQWHRRKSGRSYRECKICKQKRIQDMRRGVRSKWGLTQRMLNKATIEHEPMAECYACLPSPVTGIRGRVLPDDEDGGVKCFACGRGQRATVVLEVVG